MVLLAGCGSQKNAQNTQSQPLTSDSVHIVQEQRPTPTPQLSILTHVTTPTLTPTSTKSPSIPPSSPPKNISSSGSRPAPYEPPPPLITEETHLTQQLFALINHDRAVRGLYAFTWNTILEIGRAHV